MKLDSVDGCGECRWVSDNELEKVGTIQVMQRSIRHVRIGAFILKIVVSIKGLSAVMWLLLWKIIAGEEGKKSRSKLIQRSCLGEGVRSW